MTDYDSRAADLFHGATTDFAPDVDRLVQGGVLRGRTLRRRRRVGTSLAAVAVVGVLGVAVSAGSELFGSVADSAPSQYADSPSAAPSAASTAVPTATLPIDALVVIPAEDVPSVIGDLVPGGTIGEILRDPPYGVTDEAQRKTVHFLYDGTLATFSIERADSLGTCAEQVDPASQADGKPGGECVDEGGVLLLRAEPETADGVTGQSVAAFVHGYVVSALSYNAPGGKDVTPALPQPPLTMEDLTTIVTSEEWFGS